MNNTVLLGNKRKSSVNLYGCVLYLPLWSPELKTSPITSRDFYRHSCTVTGDVTWGSTGRTFLGSDDYITIPDAASIQNIFDSGGTVMFWIKPTSCAGAERPVEKQAWCVYFNAAASGKTVPTLFYDFSGNDLYHNFAAGGVGITIGAWSHLAVTMANAAGGTVPVTYINGVAGGSTTQASTGTRVSDAAKDLLLGIRANLTQDLNGVVGDYFAYQGRVLTGTEIKRNYQATKWRYGL